jgi:uncharacterized membrane protein
LLAELNLKNFQSSRFQYIDYLKALKFLIEFQIFLHLLKKFFQKHQKILLAILQIDEIFFAHKVLHQNYKERLIIVYKIHNFQFYLN